MPVPAINTRVKYTGDVANLPFTGTVVKTYESQWGEFMDVLLDVPEGDEVLVRRGVPCHAFPETGPGARWVLASEGERREFYTGFEPDLSNID